MARFIQLLLPLICAVFGEAHLDLPFFDIPGLQHPSHPDPDTIQKQPLDKDIKNIDHQAWLHHVLGQRHPSNSDRDVHSFNRHHKESYEDFNPFLNGGFDRYFGGSYGMGHFDPTSSITFPGMSNAFNVPDNGFNSHNIQQPQEVGNPEEQHKKYSNNDITEAKNPIEKPEDVSASDKKSTEQDKDPKASDVDTLSTTKQPEELPPKTNEVNKNITSEDTGDKNQKVVDLNKNKDYLLVGSGNNGNNVYLLHENNPNPTTVVVPNANQPANNVVYIPYYPGQNINPASQVVNQQPTNLQVSPSKITVNGYNNGVATPAQAINTGNQNPGYVLVYSNGQLMQIPGVVVNSAQNNVPVQNSNPIQGTSYIIANSVPNNTPATQNTGTNVIYATLPNQGSNGPIVIQMPQCIHGMSNNVCGSGTVVQNPVQGVNNAASIMSNNGLVSNVINPPNQNMGAQPAILLTSGVSNSYAQPTMVPQGVNTVVSLPTQGAVFSNQNATPQLAVQLPVNSNSFQYNQPIVTSLQPNIAVNTPNQVAVNSQHVQLQPAVQIAANTSPNGYNNQPLVTIQPSNVATQNQGVNNQNLPSTSVNSASNGNHQQIAPNQGNQSIDVVVNAPSHDLVANQPQIDIRNAVPATSLSNNDAVSMGLDDNSFASLGAQPAIMISGFRETTDNKNDKKNGKAKKGKKDKSKKKSKKNKDSSESKEEKSLNNKKK